MDILDSIAVTTRAAETITQIATYDWDGPSKKRAVFASILLIGTALGLHVISNKTKKVEEKNE